MRASQQIFPIRREYNQWVANQTLEDYALRFTAVRGRRWSAWQVAMTALGATAFMALEAIGGAITLNYGFTNACYAILMVGLAIFVTGWPISYYAARYGVDIDLLTRGAGFGYLGSTVTSLIYASFTFIFFAIEAAILAMALYALFGIPPSIGYIVCAVAVVPIVTHGITAISRFQLGSQWLWLGLQIVALGAVAAFEWRQVDDWRSFAGTESGGQRGFNLALFGAASAMLFALMAQIGEQVDYLRFLPARESIPARHWWSALLLAGPGWILIGIVKLLAGSFMAWLAFSNGAGVDQATDPTRMYQAAFAYLTHSPAAALLLAGVLVILSQMKINVTNAYAGSIAWSNFFARVTRSHPGRVVWLVFNVAIALLLMELSIYEALENTLGLFAIVAVSWLGTIAADLTVNRWLGLRPPGIEFKRAHLYDVNPVGVGAMLAAVAAGVACYSGALGDAAHALTHYLTLLTTFVAAPLIAWYTGGKYYLARPPALDAGLARPLAPELELTYLPTQDLGAMAVHECCICNNSFENADMSHCPAYQRPICSLCCSLDSLCLDRCKPHGRLQEQLRGWLSHILPAFVVRQIGTRLGGYLTLLGISALNTAGLLALVYFHASPGDAAGDALLVRTLWTLFFLFMIIAGVLAWVYLLARESREVAREESLRQTELLMREIDAHRRTDRDLQAAMEAADAANLAKTRYLAGISHELRTPLQSILGYAQLLTRDKTLSDEQRDSIATVRRSGEYLADLIEGLLDISRIEAGRLDIRREQVDLHALLDELSSMFRLMADDRGIRFTAQLSARLPQHVRTDNKRLRQILINLLSNAVKFTDTGQVSFIVNYRNEVAEIIVEDSGVGIGAEDLERIFRPFERISVPHRPQVPGTGLGLTIVRLLVEMLGGDINVSSQPGKGSRFTVQLMLSSVSRPVTAVPDHREIVGYAGRRRQVLVVDDDPNHRALIRELLLPLEFAVSTAEDGYRALDCVAETAPDLYLIDVSMPGMNGLELVGVLRRRGITAPVVMISADALERHVDLEQNALHDDFLVKPIRLAELLQRMAQLLELEWRYDHPGSAARAAVPPAPAPEDIPDLPAFTRLRAYAEIGYLKGVRTQLDELRRDARVDPALMRYLDHLAREALLEKMARLLEEKA